VKNKSYRAFPLGEDVARYLRSKRDSWTPLTYKTAESGLHKFVLHFCDKKLADFEPPMGTEWLEEFIDHQWGEQAPRTRANNISIIKGFFEWAVLSQRMYGDPARPIKPPKKRGVLRETFSETMTRRGSSPTAPTRITCSVTAAPYGSSSTTACARTRCVECSSSISTTTASA
jgi:hypothetical protein